MPARRSAHLGLLAAALLLLPITLSSQDWVFAVEIQGSGRATEQFETRFAAFIANHHYRAIQILLESLP